MIGGHKLLFLPKINSTELTEIMGCNRNGTGNADEARGFAPVVDKYQRRSVSPNAVTRVRRNLFGSSSVETRSFIDNELSKLRSSQNDKWNFDFVSGKPLNNPNGKYIWERVGDKTSLSTTGTQKYIQKKMTDYMGKRKISPTSTFDKTKAIKTEVCSSRTTFSGKSTSNF